MPIINNLKELEVGLKLAVVEHEYRIFKFYAIHGGMKVLHKIYLNLKWSSKLEDLFLYIFYFYILKILIFEMSHKKTVTALVS